MSLDRTFSTGLMTTLATAVWWMCPVLASNGGEPAPDFTTDVVPVLTKAGCNAGACHGAAAGRGGFHLSLFGYDPEGDYQRIVHEYEGRRIHLTRPGRSLLLRKPSGELKHEGGIRLPKQSDEYRIVAAWLAAGAPPPSARKLVKIEVAPSEKWLPKVGERFSLAVTAVDSTGRRRDVTRLCVFTPSDESSLRVNRRGKVTALRPGRHSMLVRYATKIAAVTVTVPIGNRKTASRPVRNYIDTEINRVLDQLQLPHSPPCDDITFVRRAYLDLIGTLPTPQEVDRFLADPSTGKRRKLVDRLLARPEFADYWAYQWGDLLRIESKRLGKAGADRFHRWVREQIASNARVDALARAMLTSTGDGYKSGPVNFSRVPTDANTHAEYVSEALMGVRLRCANCHNHPLDRWTQDDYHGLSAIFARLDRKQRIVAFDANGITIHPRTKKAAVPRIPGDRFLSGAGDLRKDFADWLLADDNPYFARNIVNRVWRSLMGRGLVEPVDDHRVTNPPTHPQLLDALAKDFIEHDYDLRHVIRTIVDSAAYQRSSRSVSGNEQDDRYYSRYLVRPLPPPVVVDAVAYVTGVPEKLGKNTTQRAIALGDSRVPSKTLDLLGRCDRDEGCTDSGKKGGGLPLALYTISGAWLNEKIASPKGRLQQMLAAKWKTTAIIRRFYRLALSREPAKRELEFWVERLDSAERASREQACEDFLWALLNASEFRTNH